MSFFEQWKEQNKKFNLITTTKLASMVVLLMNVWTHINVFHLTWFIFMIKKLYKKFQVVRTSERRLSDFMLMRVGIGDLFILTNLFIIIF